MVTFKMKNKPKKPKTPAHVHFEVGGFIDLESFMKSIERFKKDNPGVDPKEITVESTCDEYDSPSIILMAPPEARALYEDRLDTYEKELKSYHRWENKHAPQIKQAKADKRKLGAKRKLERLKDRLSKELAEVDSKLEKET